MKLGRDEYVALGSLTFFLAIFLVGVAAPGKYLDRLVSRRNAARRLLGVRDGLFLLLLVPLLVLIDVAYKALILYKPVSKAKKYSVYALFAGIVVALASSSASPETNVVFEQRIASHVFVVTFDGTRADVFRRASSIADELKSLGARADYGISTYPTITYPSHTTIFSGSYYVAHGVTDNVYSEIKVETVFDVAHEYLLKAAVVTPASGLANMLSRGGTAADVFSGGEYADMGKVTETAKELVDEGYNLVRLHYVESDETGHLYGADSEQYRSVIAAEQHELRELVQYIQQKGLRDDTVIIVTADHGMFVNKHHHIYPGFVDRVPFLIIGGPVKKIKFEHRPSTIDIAPTISMILGMRVPKNSVGVALGVAFGLPNVYTDTASLRLNALASSIAAAFLFASLSIVIVDRILKRFFPKTRALKAGKSKLTSYTRPLWRSLGLAYLRWPKMEAYARSISRISTPPIRRILFSTMAMA